MDASFNALWVKDGNILLADGTALTVDMLAADQWHHLIIQWTGSGFVKGDSIRICLDGNSVIYFDNLSWWQTIEAPTYSVLTEDFSSTPVNDGSKYWWGEWGTVANEEIQLVTAEYTTLRFGSPLLAGARYLTFDVKVAADDNADEFRLELGDSNIVYWSKLVEDGVTSELTEDVQTVRIDLNEYYSGNLEVLGFHINAGGVIIDNIEVSLDQYGFQMGLFLDQITE